MLLNHIVLNCRNLNYFYFTGVQWVNFYKLYDRKQKTAQNKKVFWFLTFLTFEFSTQAKIK